MTWFMFDCEVGNDLVDAFLGKLVHFVKLGLKNGSLFFACDDFRMFRKNVYSPSLLFDIILTRFLFEIINKGKQIEGFLL